MNILSGTRKLMLLASFALTLGLLAAPMPSYAGDVAIDNAVRLDPFDPVPQIGFDHGCYDPCGYHRCHEGCYRHRRHECDEDCWETYWLNREALRRYERQANMWDELVDIYIDALHLYDHKYLDGRLERDGHFRDVDHRGGRDGDGWHDGDHHDGDHHDGDHHDGEHHDGDWHDGDHHDGDHHDGDHHDGDHHDGDGHDGDHHDGDHHDGDHHDGDHHDGDHHDGDHHDGDHHDGWYDSDGHWHDGY